MKRIVTVFATAVMCLLLITVSFAESKESSASWDLSGPTEITEEVLDIFHQVTEGLMGVNYEPIALLGTTSLDEQGGDRLLSPLQVNSRLPGRRAVLCADVSSKTGGRQCKAAEYL